MPAVFEHGLCPATGVPVVWLASALMALPALGRPVHFGAAKHSLGLGTFEAEGCASEVCPWASGGLREASVFVEAAIKGPCFPRAASADCFFVALCICPCSLLCACR